MAAFAGIGSQDITELEGYTMMNLSRELTRKRRLYTGRADGSDFAFELGALCATIWLPWEGFNHSNSNCIFETVVAGATWDGISAIEEFHPHPGKLKQSGLNLMSRNWHQVMGDENHVKVDFVVCCAEPFGRWQVRGGTGQAIRIAHHHGIPAFNIRKKRWREELDEFLKTLW